MELILKKFCLSLVKMMFSFEVLNIQNGKLFCDMQVSKFIFESVAIFTSWEYHHTNCDQNNNALSSNVDIQICKFYFCLYNSKSKKIEKLHSNWIHYDV